MVVAAIKAAMPTSLSSYKGEYQRGMRWRSAAWFIPWLQFNLVSRSSKDALETPLRTDLRILTGKVALCESR